MPIKPKVLIVYKALLMGYRWEKDGYIWAMSDDGDLCVLQNKNAETGHVVDHTMSQFKKFCDKATEEDIVGMVFFMGLQEEQLDKEHKRKNYRG